MRPTTFLSTLLFSALLATCGCARANDAVGPPLLPPPPPPGCGNTGAGVCYHVATTGNDANPGTAAQPFRTIQKAADIVNAGDGVLVEDGTYTGGATVVYINRSGTEANRIVFRAANHWGAVIDGNSNASTTGIAIPGGFVWVEGFEVRNTGRYGIDTDVGHDQVVIGNNVHDIGRACTSGTGGIVGIDAYASGLVIAGNWIHDVGRFSDGENGCSQPNNNWQNHDHGIYNGIGTNVLIVNNVFFNLTHGWGIQRYDGNGEVVHGLFILNNTFVGANPNRDGQVIIATPTTNLVIANNIFYQPANVGVLFENAGSGGTLTGNLSTTTDVETGGSSLVTSGNVVGDPLFVNAAGLNFHLVGNSPARGAAVSKWCPNIDFDGVARNGACAAGAFQN